MEPISIPDKAIEAYNGERVWISGTGVGAESFEALKRDEGIYGLIHLSERDLEILNRTKTFWLGFHSKFIPVFTLRPADQYLEEDQENQEEPIPVKILDEDFYTDARNNWPALDIAGNIRGKVWVDGFCQLQLQDESRIAVKDNWFLLHNLLTGSFESWPGHIFNQIIWYDPNEVPETNGGSNGKETNRLGFSGSESDNEEDVQPVLPSKSRFQF